MQKQLDLLNLDATQDNNNPITFNEMLNNLGIINYMPDLFGKKLHDYTKKT